MFCHIGSVFGADTPEQFSPNRVSDLRSATKGNTPSDSPQQVGASVMIFIRPMRQLIRR